MQPDVRLLIQPSVDWNLFLNTTKQGLGRSVTKELDSRRQDVKSPLGFVHCLGEMLGDTEPQGRLSILRQMSFSFLVITDEETLTELLRTTSGLSVVSATTVKKNVELSVITSSLDAWLIAIAACTTGNESYELRYLFDAIMLIFESMGFHRLFLRWVKQSMPDQTFKLIPKS